MKSHAGPQSSTSVTKYHTTYVENVPQAPDSERVMDDLATGRHLEERRRVGPGFGSGMEVMAPFTNMPPDVAELAKTTMADIGSGKLNVFAGPINDQAGALKVPPGKVLDDGELSAMQWLAQGVEEKLI